MRVVVDSPTIPGRVAADIKSGSFSGEPYLLKVNPSSPRTIQNWGTDRRQTLPPIPPFRMFAAFHRMRLGGSIRPSLLSHYKSHSALVFIMFYTRPLRDKGALQAEARPARRLERASGQHEPKIAGDWESFHNTAYKLTSGKFENSELMPFYRCGTDLPCKLPSRAKRSVIARKKAW